MAYNARGDEQAADAARAAHERRLRLNRSVRDARDVLTSTSGVKPAFDYELLRLYAEHRIGASLALFMLISLVGIASSLWTGGLGAVIWTMIALTIHSLNVAACRRFLDSPADPALMQRYRILFTMFDLIFGVSWVLIVNVLVGLGAQGSGDFSLFAMLLVVAVFSMLAASIPSAVYAATLPVAGVVTLHYLLRGTPQDVVLAILTIGAEAYFVMVAGRLHIAAVSALEARAQLDTLIGELEQSKAKSDEAARRAEAANLAKSRFLAQMSHELRTPLNAILGFSEVMKDEVLGAHSVPAYKEYAADIHDSGGHLLNLINEILDLSRIEAGRYELNEEPVNVVFIAEDCHHMTKMRAGVRGITIHALYEPDLPKLWADERALRQICLNLLSNAIKFTPQGGEVFVKVGWTASGGQYISVRDTGPGIPEEEIPVVLASFGQGSNAIKSAEQGAGLGLPIVKGLVDLHGGTFTLRSKLREGTEVLVTFPAERVMAALAPVTDEAPLQPKYEQKPARTAAASRA
ncbi:MAG: HAMP domain-containing histidine kinase [Xanthobacteraceae bacterium]|nr:HAMP domain-containing histidine kinase [Xanthobacteraceae bacterium]QYK45836.1 MAG: HAMP domain-containing histidine kinase [Xanthobacteraceae bacterium]